MSVNFMQKVFKNGVKSSSKRCLSGFCPSALNGRIGILGVPFGKGQKKKGREEVGLKIAPNAIRGTGFCEILRGLGADISDYGDVTYEPDCALSYFNMNNFDHFSPCAREVSDQVENILCQERSSLVLGGDHSIAVGSINAHLKVAGPKNIALVYVDAHADINTDRSSPSGNIHGMTVAMLAKELQSSWSKDVVSRLDWIFPSLPLSSVAYIGVRSVDSGEVKYLCQNDVAVYGMDDVEKFGIHKVLNRAMLKIDPASNKSIHVSFDIDALDYFEAPCTGVPVRGGLTLREGIEIAEFMHHTHRVSVLDIVEVSPTLGDENQRRATLDAAKHIILSIYGYSRRGNTIPKNP